MTVRRPSTNGGTGTARTVKEQLERHDGKLDKIEEDLTEFRLDTVTRFGRVESRIAQGVALLAGAVFVIQIVAPWLERLIP